MNLDFSGHSNWGREFFFKGGGIRGARDANRRWRDQKWARAFFLDISWLFALFRI